MTKYLETFNAIFHGRKLRYNDLSLEQNLVSTYLAPNIDRKYVRGNYRRTIIASFVKDCASRIGLETDVESILEDTASQYYEDSDIDSMLQEIECEDLDKLIRRKPPKKQTQRQKLEPNNAAIMAGILYGKLMRHKNLLGYVNQASDIRDLQGLMTIDYMFRTTRREDLQEILAKDISLESKAYEAMEIKFEINIDVLEEDYRRIKKYCGSSSLSLMDSVSVLEEDTEVDMRTQSKLKNSIRKIGKFLTTPLF